MPHIDRDVLWDKVQLQILRSAKPALRKLARASRGRSDFKNELELRACLGLARVAATLLRKTDDEHRRVMKQLLSGR